MDTDGLIGVGVAAAVVGVGLHIMSKGMKAVKKSTKKSKGIFCL